MTNSFLIAVLAGLGGMFGWGFADFFAKKTIDKTDDITTLFWAQTIGIVPLLGIFLTSPNIPKLAPFDPLFLVLFGVVGGLSYLLLYRGFGKGEVSLLSPIFASYAAVVVLLSTLLFNETLPPARILAVIVVLSGLLLISSDPRDIRRLLHTRTTPVKGVPEVLFAMLAYSLWLVLFDRLIHGKSWVFYLLSVRIIAAITLFVFARLRQRSIVVKNKSLWKFLVAIGVFDVAAFSFVSYGFSHTPHLSIVAVLSATFSVPTIVLAHIFLKEKATRLQFTATAIIIAGIVLISIGQSG